MKKLFATALTSALLSSAALLPQQAQALPLSEEVVYTARSFLFGSQKQQTQALLRKSRAVVIIPKTVKLAFIVGGSGGEGLMLSRNSTGEWASIHRVRLYEGSVGFQAGINTTETMLFVLTQEAASAIRKGKFQLGAEAGLAVATVGADIGAALSNKGHAIIGLTKSKGLYGGVSLEGAYLQPFNGPGFSPEQMASILKTLEISRP